MRGGGGGRGIQICFPKKLFWGIETHLEGRGGGRKCFFRNIFEKCSRGPETPK